MTERLNWIGLSLSSEILKEIPATKQKQSHTRLTMLLIPQAGGASKCVFVWGVWPLVWLQRHPSLVSKVTAYSCHSNLLHLDISHPPRAVRLLWSLILISFPVLFSHSLLLENPFGAVIWKDTCTPVFTKVLFTTAKMWKQHKCPSTEEWVKRMYIYATGHYSAIKRNEIMPFTATQMNREIIVLS